MSLTRVEISGPALEKAQKISERVVLWTTDMESLLRQWKKQLNRRSEGHVFSEAKFNKRYYILGIPTSIIGTIGSTGALATFRNCASSATGGTSGGVWCQIDQWVRLLFGAICLLSAVMTGLMVFLNYGGRAEKHKTAADNYTSLAREIDTILRIRPIDRPDAIETIQSVRSRFDDSAKNSPPIPEEFAITLDYNFEPRGSGFEGQRQGSKRKSGFFGTRRSKASTNVNITVADVENGLGGVTPSETGLARILLGIDDDDDSEVGAIPTIPFDIEKMGSQNRGMGGSQTGLERSILGKKELQFELSRFTNADDNPIYEYPEGAPSRYPEYDRSAQLSREQSPEAVFRGYLVKSGEYGDVISPRLTHQSVPPKNPNYFPSSTYGHASSQHPNKSVSESVRAPGRGLNLEFSNETTSASAPPGDRVQRRDTSRVFPLSGPLSYYTVTGAGVSSGLENVSSPPITVRRQGRSFPNAIPETSRLEQSSSPKVSPGRSSGNETTSPLGKPSDEVCISDSGEKSSQSQP